MATKEEIIEQIKTVAAEIGKTHGKAALMDVNAKLIPLGLDLMAASIPGQIDDMVIAAAKPVVKDALDNVIESI